MVRSAIHENWTPPNFPATQYCSASMQRKQHLNCSRHQPPHLDNNERYRIAPNFVKLYMVTIRQHALALAACTAQHVATPTIIVNFRDQKSNHEIHKKFGATCIQYMVSMATAVVLALIIICSQTNHWEISKQIHVHDAASSMLSITPFLSFNMMAA